MLVTSTTRALSTSSVVLSTEAALLWIVLLDTSTKLTSVLQISKPFSDPLVSPSEARLSSRPRPDRLRLEAQQPLDRRQQQHREARPDLSRAEDLAAMVARIASTTRTIRATRPLTTQLAKRAHLDRLGGHATSTNFVNAPTAPQMHQKQRQRLRPLRRRPPLLLPRKRLPLWLPPQRRLKQLPR